MATPQHVSIEANRLESDEALNEVVREMCSYDNLNGRYLVQMPVATALGALVSVSVWPEGGGDTYLVSDDGAAYQAVSTACAAEKTFSTVAAARCKKHGASFDGYSLMYIRVPKSHLKGAIIMMSNLTREVIDLTLEQ